MADRMQGKVKWWNGSKGFGFIQPIVENPGNSTAPPRDVFVHVSALKEAGIEALYEGDFVEYQLVTNKGKQAAGKIVLLRGDSAKVA